MLNHLMEHIGRSALPLPPPPPVEDQEQEGDEELPEFSDVDPEVDVAPPRLLVARVGGAREQVRAVVYPYPVMDSRYPAGHPVQGIPQFPQLMQGPALTIQRPVWYCLFMFTGCQCLL